NPEQLAYYPTATNEKAKFHYDDKTQTLSFPVIIEDKNKQLTLTDQRIQYRFDGLYFFRLRHNVASQSCGSIDSMLQRTYNEMIKNGSYGGDYNEDKLIAATLRFESTLKSYLLQSSSLECRFPKMSELFYSAHIQSEDGKLNAFSWDNQTGGTMHNFGYVLQYVRDEGKPAILNMNGGESGRKVIHIVTASLNNKPYYWVIDYGIGGGRNHLSVATLYEMDGNTLKEAKLVKTNEAITSYVSLAFDPSIMEDNIAEP
ncbi:MAG TPA: hypothetical protein DD638_09380, partial [Pasteurellaceae bacterium]|nr:hypothetical protein [Pasteurellaceae bacterium]